MSLETALKDSGSVRAGCVSLYMPEDDPRAKEASLKELDRLLYTAGAQPVFRLIQQKQSPDVRTYIGKGKVGELAQLCEANEVRLVVFDAELSPSQIRNLENELGEEIQIIDRSMLILDIFALHATSGEGKLQVELAQLKYTVPRLVGKGLELSRQGGTGGGGAIAARGPGETKLETDRRHIKRRMQALEEEIEALSAHRATQRKQRERSGIFRFAIAGYTNAGKSTLLNRLTDAGILAEDKLFATLDPTSRKFTLPCGDEVLLTDTVGFIRNLPHHLIRSFRSTLDEVALSDAILVLIDASDPEHRAQLSVTESLLSELSCSDKPILYVYNKCDCEADADTALALSSRPEGVSEENCLYVSARTGQGLEALVKRMEEIVTSGSRRCAFFLPFADAGVLNRMYGAVNVEKVDYTDDGIEVVAVCDEKGRGMFAKWMKE